MKTTTARLRLVLVDDQALFREALVTLLRLQPDFEIVGEATQGDEAVEVAARLRPDVILMDLRMPGIDGVEATRRICAADAAARVLVLTTFDEDDLVFEALRAGAKGYLLKACSADVLNDAVRRTARAESTLDPAVATKVVTEFSRLSTHASRKPATTLPDPLSARELAVLRLLAEGRSNKEIGSALHITEGTVKNHMTGVLGKLSVLDRTQAALRARDLGLI